MHRHDKKWITQQLLRLPPDKRGAVWEEYKALFSKAFDAEPIEHKKENAARKTANNMLRSTLTNS